MQGSPPAETRIEDAYPLPWKWEEAWTGTEIKAANNKRVVMITKGRSSNRIDEERELADLIVRCVNTGASQLSWWRDEAALLAGGDA